MSESPSTTNTGFRPFHPGWWTEEANQDRAALTVLIVLSFFIAVPALSGGAYLSGDNLYQNFPLRVLTGRLIREGHLPLWNPGIWSGTALIGGFNGGGAYPLTVLFAFLSPLAAWTLNALSVFVVAGTGMYLLLRTHRLAPLAAFLGAMCETFAGFMPSEFVHLALVQGMAFIPWMLLALEKLAAQKEGRWGYWILLCFAGAMTALAGEPRCCTSSAIVALIYFIPLLRRAPLRRQLIAMTAVALPTMLALAALQLLPGIPFVHQSQRGHSDYGWFAQGPNWELIPRMIVPFFRTFHTPWNYPYWDTEVWGYVGVLPNAAFLGYLFWRRESKGPHGTWMLLVIVGFILSLAGLTPLGPILHKIPLYGGERAQSRNLSLVDLGLAGLFGCWVDRWLRRLDEPTERWKQLANWALTLLPSAMMISLLYFVLQPGANRSLLMGMPARIYLPYTGAAIGFFSALILVASRWKTLPTAPRTVALVSFVLLDLYVAFTHLEFTSTPIEPLLASSPLIEEIRGATGDYGRFGNFDPAMVGHDTLGTQLTPNVFLVLNLHSVEGLGSVVDKDYDERTDGHNWRHFSPDAMGNEVADELNLRFLLVPASAFVQRRGSKDGNIATSLTLPHWQEGERSGMYRTFTNLRAKGRAWIEADSAVEVAPAAGDTVSVAQVDSQDGETDNVTTDGPALLVRSVGYGDGWKATLQAPGGQPKTVPVQRHDVVQAVEVPGGPLTVTWHYDPPGATLGFFLSLIAALGLSGLGAALVVARLVSHRSLQSNESREAAAA